MNKVEFLKNVCDLTDGTGVIKDINENEYAHIEYVYTWHPSIDPVKGKEQIAYLYSNFGMRIILDMLTTAKAAEECELQLKRAREAYEKAIDNYNRLKDGTTIQL